MIEWRPISNPPPMLEVDEKPTRLAGRLVPSVWCSAYVLVWLSGGSWQRDRICRIDDENRAFDEVFGEVFGFAVTHWSEVNSPTEGKT
jgi:hypothetical protein